MCVVLFKGKLNLCKVGDVQYRCLPDPFIAQGRAIILCPRAQRVIPGWLETYYSTRVFMARYS
jgi:hypothetical protein